MYPDNGKTLKVFVYIYVQLGQINKGKGFIRRATPTNPSYNKSFLELEELLILVQHQELYQVVYHFLLVLVFPSVSTKVQVAYT